LALRRGITSPSAVVVRPRNRQRLPRRQGLAQLHRRPLEGRKPPGNAAMSGEPIETPTRRRGSRKKTTLRNVEPAAPLPRPPPPHLPSPPRQHPPPPPPLRQPLLLYRHSPQPRPCKRRHRVHPNRLLAPQPLRREPTNTRPRRKQKRVARPIPSCG